MTNVEKNLALKAVACSASFQRNMNDEVHGLGYWQKKSIVRAFFFPLLCVIALADNMDAGKIRGTLLFHDMINLKFIGAMSRPTLSRMLKMLLDLHYIYISNEKDIHNKFSAKEYKLSRKGKALINEYFAVVENYQFFENPRPSYK